MLHSREFIAGLASLGISQFLWTLARLLLLPPGEDTVIEWTLGSLPGFVLAFIVVTIMTAVATAIRTDDVNPRMAFFRILAGTYLGMFVSLVVIAPASRWPMGILYGLGLLLPPLAFGSVAGEIIRKVRRRGKPEAA